MKAFGFEEKHKVKTIEKNVHLKKTGLRKMRVTETSEPNDTGSKYMNKFIRKDLENPEFADHMRFCSSCGRETFRWTCCGKRTSRVKIQ